MKEFKSKVHLQFLHPKLTKSNFPLPLNHLPTLIPYHKSRTSHPIVPNRIAQKHSQIPERQQAMEKQEAKKPETCPDTFRFTKRGAKA